MKIDTIALDMEGTLISNAISQFPRPGLSEFLEFCADSFKNIVIYTAVPEKLCIKIQELLVKESVAPLWFSKVPYVHWDYYTKNLLNIPNTTPEKSLILDDNPDYIAEEQFSQWIPIKTFESPYSDTDNALFRVKTVIEARIAHRLL